MRPNDLPLAPAATAPEVYQQLGQITRQLHDALQQLGLMPKLQRTALDLPDARSRLDFIARKSGEAADRVLSAVDAAKAEHHGLQAAARRMALRCGADPSRTLAAPEVLDFVRAVEVAAARIDQQLTDIMLAQDFHDLTGQVVARVGALVVHLEASLLQLLVQASADAGPAPPGAGALHGPVVCGMAAAEVVHSQREVDELLASLGF
jgi:chemotaxis protein CheZ